MFHWLLACMRSRQLRKNFQTSKSTKIARPAKLKTRVLTHEKIQVARWTRSSTSSRHSTHSTSATLKSRACSPAWLTIDQTETSANSCRRATTTIKAGLLRQACRMGLTHRSSALSSTELQSRPTQSTKSYPRPLARDSRPIWLMKCWHRSQRVHLQTFSYQASHRLISDPQNTYKKELSFTMEVGAVIKLWLAKKIETMRCIFAEMTQHSRLWEMRTLQACRNLQSSVKTSSLRGSLTA